MKLINMRIDQWFEFDVSDLHRRHCGFRWFVNLVIFPALFSLLHPPPSFSSPRSLHTHTHTPFKRLITYKIFRNLQENCSKITTVGEAERKIQIKIDRKSPTTTTTTTKYAFFVEYFLFANETFSITMKCTRIIHAYWKNYIEPHMCLLFTQTRKYCVWFIWKITL